MRSIALILAPAIVLAAFAPAAVAETVAPSPIKMAVFPFELEDFSAGAAYIPPDDIDREQLRLSTEEARRLIAASGRYQLVDVSAVNDQAAKAGKLRDCDGCEARIAAGLDADQSMIGIVTRITRMEYAVTFKLRDARSGAIVAVEQTDLRMGANVAWSRGARWLIQNRLLERRNSCQNETHVTKRQRNHLDGKADETTDVEPRFDRRRCCLRLFCPARSGAGDDARARRRRNPLCRHLG